MHIEILDNKRIELLKKLSILPIIDDFILGGGTAVSLILGLRESFDFDFFSYQHFNIDQLEEILKNNFNDLVVINKFVPKSTLDVLINGIKVSFLEYSYKEIDEFVKLEEFNNLKLFSLIDLMTMKCAAITQRGSKKDFFDLFFVLKETNIKAPRLKKLLMDKYNNEDFIVAFNCSISFFEDAEGEMLPKTFVSFNWEEIKNYFLKFQKDFLRF